MSVLFSFLPNLDENVYITSCICCTWQNIKCEREMSLSILGMSYISVISKLFNYVLEQKNQPPLLSVQRNSKYQIIFSKTKLMVFNCYRSSFLHLSLIFYNNSGRLTTTKIYRAIVSIITNLVCRIKYINIE